MGLGVGELLGVGDADDDGEEESDGVAAVRSSVGVLDRLIVIDEA